MSILPASWTLVLLAGCSLGPEETHWSSKLTPSGPCWDINLADGIDETSTDELHDVFSCLNRQGNLEALTDVDRAMEAENRSGEPIGLTVAKLTNALPTSGYDLLGLAGKALQLFEDYHEDADLILEAAVESIYGIPYEQVSDEFDLGSPDNLNAGVLVPAITLGSEAASVLLDGGTEAHEDVVSMLESDLFDAAACTMAGVVFTEDPRLKPIGDGLMGSLAEAWIRASNTENDIWDGASGNSIRDLIDLAAIGEDVGPMDELRPIVRALLADDNVQRNTKIALTQAAAAGHIVHLPVQLQYLADVSASGIPLSSGTAGQVSALQAGARLIHQGNTEVDCRIDIPILPDIEFSLGNLSVSILERLAEMDEDAAVDSVGFLGEVLNFGLTQTILDTILSTDVCPVLNDDLIDDLIVLERLNDPAVGNLVEVIHGMLDAVYQEGELNRLPETVDLMSVLYAKNLLPPLEEGLRDLASSDLAGSMTTIIETVLEPSALNDAVCDDDTQPLDFEMLWVAAKDGLADDETGALSEVAQVTLDNPALWTFFDHGAQLAAQPEARIHQLPEVLVNLLLDDQAGLGLDAIRTAVRDPNIWGPSLEVLENPELMAAVTAPTGEHEGPLPFVARLIRSDTVTVMLQTIDLLLDSLGDD